MEANATVEQIAVMRKHKWWLEIHELTRNGIGSRAAAEKLGITTNVVSMVKMRMRDEGIPIAHSWATERVQKPKQVNMEAARDCDPDLDEPPIDPHAERCKCGLLMPCHACLDTYLISTSAPKRGRDLPTDDRHYYSPSAASRVVTRGRRRPNRASQVLQPVETSSGAQDTKEAQSRVHDQL